MSDSSYDDSIFKSTTTERILNEMTPSDKDMEKRKDLLQAQKERKNDTFDKKTLRISELSELIKKASADIHKEIEKLVREIESSPHDNYNKADKILEMDEFAVQIMRNSSFLSKVGRDADI